MTAFSDSALVYRDLDGVWGSFRLFVGGKDVTTFRGVPAQIGSYQLQEPYSYGSAEFALPSLTSLEVDAWGTGDLAWMGNGKPVKLVQVDADGVLVRVVWRGFISSPEVTNDGVLLHCDGEATGRLAMRIKTPDLFVLQRHVGAKLYYAFSDCNLTLTPYLGSNVGVRTDGRGMTGSMLDYANELLAATIDTDGSQYTIWRRDTGDYHLGPKDTETVDFTVFNGAHGVELDVADDITERPTSVYGQGIAPNGLVWVNGRYPGLIQGDTPPYPMTDNSSFGVGTTDADTDTGDGVSLMIAKLAGMGYLDAKDRPGGFDSDAADAIEDLQNDAGLTVSGNMTAATWRALYDLDSTGYSLLGSFIQPLAQDPAVYKWFRTSNGSPLRRNPDWDPSVPERDIYVDHGPGVEKSRARRYSKGILHRAMTAKNWSGTMTLTADVFAGTATHDDVSPTILSRLDITAGMNVLVRHFDLNTTFHVSVVNVDSNLNVTLGIDTQARDAATLGEVIARRIQSRSNPARAWLHRHNTHANVAQIQFSEVGGRVFSKVACPGGEWTVFPVVAGQAGTVSRVRMQTSGPEAAFVVVITAKKTSARFWQGRVGNPLAGVPLDDVSLKRSGSGYTSAPTVSFTGGGGAGASATATVSGGQVVSINLTDAGAGYAAPPTVSFTGGGGTGATATAYVSPVNKFDNARLSNLIDRDRALLGVWGAPDQPCGYQAAGGGSYTNRNGQLTGDPITGLFFDDGGFDYHTFGQPVLWVAVYPDRDTVIRPQRILWPVEELIT